MDIDDSEKVYIIDFGSQYTHLISRRIRSLGIYCSVVSMKTVSKFEEDVRGIFILSGGPECAYESGLDVGDLMALKGIAESERTYVFGVCFGLQILAHILGGKVSKGTTTSEYGETSIIADGFYMDHPLLRWLYLENSQHEFEKSTEQYAENKTFLAWMSHNDYVSTLPKGFVCYASSNDVEHALIGNSDIHVYGSQFHPEVTHTEGGDDILRGFLYDVCGLEANWDAEDKISECNDIIKDSVSVNDHVVLGISGGVDSSTTGALLLNHLGQTKVSFVLIDTGMMRLNEIEEVKQCLSNVGMDCIVVDYSEAFFEALRGVVDPEKKRKTIGKLFIEAFENAIDTHIRSKFGPNTTFVLGQGTIYPDVIESARKANGAHVIKSHHNVGGLPEKLGWKLVEPLKDLFKDEVREIGESLGLPKDLINRHPFPGPGLAIRVLGEVTKEKVAIVQKADYIYNVCLRKCGVYSKISQAYAALLDSKSVGVVGDQRRYGYIILLRAVCTDDFMTASIFEFDKKILSSIATQIVNSIKEVSRVVYDVTTKPPGTIELE